MLWTLPTPDHFKIQRSAFIKSPLTDLTNLWKFFLIASNVFVFLWWTSVKHIVRRNLITWSFPLLAAKDFTTVLLSYNLMCVCILYIWSYNRTSALYFISCHVNFVWRLCLNSVLIFNVYSETLNTRESAAVRSSWCSGFRFKSAGSFHSHFYSQHVLSVNFLVWESVSHVQHNTKNPKKDKHCHRNTCVLI